MYKTRLDASAREKASMATMQNLLKSEVEKLNHALESSIEEQNNLKETCSIESKRWQSNIGMLLN